MNLGARQAEGLQPRRQTHDTGVGPEFTRMGVRQAEGLYPQSRRAPQGSDQSPNGLSLVFPFFARSDVSDVFLGPNFKP